MTDEINEIMNTPDFSLNISKIDDSIVVKFSRELNQIDIIEALAHLFLLVPSDLREDVFQVVMDSIKKYDDLNYFNNNVDKLQ